MNDDKKNLEMEKKIKEISEFSLIYTLTGMLGLGFFILCPLGYIKGTKAIKLIDQYKVGEEHRANAKFAKNASVVIFAAYFLLIILFFAFG